LPYLQFSWYFGVGIGVPWGESYSGKGSQCRQYHGIQVVFSPPKPNVSNTVLKGKMGIGAVLVLRWPMPFLVHAYKQRTYRVFG
jgi:hypothetical protein